MMNLFRASIIFSTAVLSVGCSNLDSSSAFDDVAKSVKERHNYTQVIAKDITPEAKAIRGSDIVKSELNYVGNFPKNLAAKIESSYVDMNVTYFKSYDRFETVSYGVSQFPLNDYRPLAETCTEHCTVTQWFKFPLSQEYLKHLEQDLITFTLSSSTDKSVVEFSVPRGYFLAVIDEANFVTTKRSDLQVDLNTNVVSSGEQISKSYEMVQYWYGKASSSEKSDFATFAIANRNAEKNAVKSSSQALSMMKYWYLEGSVDERKTILQWLINQ
ncbi:hypothetical protein RAL01_001474 [Vibrio vulnificus]|jgi:hypothetical protein|uniref:hypothetical protein n=1 Tax=Vibrio vulnificus TaxID=672 RepID=UPI0009C667C3|nr:hypothetical protein [Vibrio vulnificus]AUL94921.1 lipoprotein [Vibrio vulnificus]EGQ9311097.1 DUF2057 domain-containing protein [Vibrio vulnificus]EGR0060976.1 DUF2057 domain-containing protein [Vibrio vulnificus]EGR0229761.1 DUF2057 domain-containing protein [Vibrio vulnificus]EGR0351847.1 DUF2057 domain-containing protein [Vibrio vulnificus]